MVTFDIAYIETMLVAVVPHGGDIDAEIAINMGDCPIDRDAVHVIQNVAQVNNTDEYDSADVEWRNGVYGRDGGYVRSSAVPWRRINPASL